MSDFFNQSFSAIQDQLLASFFYLASFLTLPHLLDIFLTGILIFWLYRFLKGTNFLRSLLPLVFVLIGSFLAQALSLELLSGALGVFVLIWFLISLLTFQSELAELLSRRLIRERKILSPKWVIREMILALSALRSSNLAAILLIRRGKSLRSLVSSGLAVNQPLTSELLVQSFGEKSHLKKGAALIEGDRVISLGVLSKKLSPHSTNIYLKKLAAQLDAVAVILNRAGRVGVLSGRDSYSQLRFSDLENVLTRSLRS